MVFFVPTFNLYQGFVYTGNPMEIGEKGKGKAFLPEIFRRGLVQGILINY